MRRATRCNAALPERTGCFSQAAARRRPKFRASRPPEIRHRQNSGNNNRGEACNLGDIDICRVPAPEKHARNAPPTPASAKRFAHPIFSHRQCLYYVLRHALVKQEKYFPHSTARDFFILEETANTHAPAGERPHDRDTKAKENKNIQNNSVAIGQKQNTLASIVIIMR